MVHNCASKPLVVASHATGGCSPGIQVSQALQQELHAVHTNPAVHQNARVTSVWATERREGAAGPTASGNRRGMPVLPGCSTAAQPPAAADRRLATRCQQQAASLPHLSGCRNHGSKMNSGQRWSAPWAAASSAGLSCRRKPWMEEWQGRQDGCHRPRGGLRTACNRWHWARSSKVHTRAAHLAKPNDRGHGAAAAAAAACRRSSAAASVACGNQPNVLIDPGALVGRLADTHSSREAENAGPAGGSEHAACQAALRCSARTLDSKF